MMNSIALGFSLLQPFHAPCVYGYPQWGFNNGAVGLALGEPIIWIDRLNYAVVV